MTSKLKIGIVEDDIIIADSLSEMLVEIGYRVPDSAARYSEAIDLIEKEQPDLLLLDINLIGKLDGIDVAETVRKKFNIPFIFLTANLDVTTVERAKEVFPAAYLAKPITKEQLYSAIEIALNNFNHSVQKPENIKPQITSESIFIKDGYAFRKVIQDEILYVESEANYISIFLCDGSKIVNRSKLDDFLEQLNAFVFIRIHRSYAINRNKIERVFPTELSINSVKIPISKSYRAELLNLLGIKE